MAWLAIGKIKAAARRSRHSRRWRLMWPMVSAGPSLAHGARNSLRGNARLTGKRKLVYYVKNNGNCGFRRGFAQSAPWVSKGPRRGETRRQPHNLRIKPKSRGAQMEGALHKIITRCERWTVIALLLMMVLVIVISTVELAIILYKDLVNPPFLLFQISELLNLFSFFFMILIGLELVETIKMYLDEEKVHVEVVFLVAMIAVARKVIVLDTKEQDAMTLLAVAAIVVALSAGYYLVKKAHDKKSAENT
jgi:uncharacterized membrane protein (DUF373 family)